MIEKLKHKYALSEKGAKDMVRAFVAVTLANLALMVPVGLLYVLASCLLDGSLPKEDFVTASYFYGGHSCAACYACLHWCPKNATLLKVPFLKHRPQYHHPDVTLAEIKE